MRYTAPFGARRSSRVEPVDAGPPTSTIDIDVISADTDGTGARDDGSGVGRSMSSVLTGAPPDPGRPLTAATYSMPLSSNRSARISWNGESRRTNALPSASTRSTLPGDPVPTRRLPLLSNASDVTCVAFVL